MARADLAAMLGRLEETPSVKPQPDIENLRLPRDASESTTSRADLRPANSNSTPSPGKTATGYLSFERKEARLRPDQYTRLTEESRRLGRAKGAGGERITENTLIRIAIDLLLERSEQLAGTTEIELRKSVSL